VEQHSISTSPEAVKWQTKWQTPSIRPFRHSRTEAIPRLLAETLRPGVLWSNDRVWLEWLLT
jgi:hypothetical protein